MKKHSHLTSFFATALCSVLLSLNACSNFSSVTLNFDGKSIALNPTKADPYTYIMVEQPKSTLIGLTNYKASSVADENVFIIKSADGANYFFSLNS